MKKFCDTLCGMTLVVGVASIFVSVFCGIVALFRGDHEVASRCFAGLLVSSYVVALPLASDYSARKELVK